MYYLTVEACSSFYVISMLIIIFILYLPVLNFSDADNSFCLLEKKGMELRPSCLGAKERRKVMFSFFKVEICSGFF